MSERPRIAPTLPPSTTIDGAADWIAAAVTGGKVKDARFNVRNRAVVALVRACGGVVVIPHEGIVNTNDRRVK